MATTAVPAHLDVVPAALHRAAARTVVRFLLPAQAALLGLGVIEVADTGQALPLQLAAAAVLLTTLPGTVIATEALARFRYDGALRRMEAQLDGSSGS